MVFILLNTVLAIFLLEEPSKSINNILFSFLVKIGCDKFLSKDFDKNNLPDEIFFRQGNIGRFKTAYFNISI